jgi:hypothetical protein
MVRFGMKKQGCCALPRCCLSDRSWHVCDFSDFLHTCAKNALLMRKVLDGRREMMLSSCCGRRLFVVPWRFVARNRDDANCCRHAPAAFGPHRSQSVKAMLVIVFSLRSCATKRFRQLPRYLSVPGCTCGRDSCQGAMMHLAFRARTHP